MNLYRRELLTAAAAAGMISLAGCSQQSQEQFAQQIEAILEKVQAGVVAACAAFGKWVPTIETVVAVLTSIAGGNALAGITQVVIDDAIQTIAKACGPTPAPTAIVKGTVVPIKFY